MNRNQTKFHEAYQLQRHHLIQTNDHAKLRLELPVLRSQLPATLACQTTRKVVQLPCLNLQHAPVSSQTVQNWACHLPLKKLTKNLKVCDVLRPHGIVIANHVDRWDGCQNTLHTNDVHDDTLHHQTPPCNLKGYRRSTNSPPVVFLKLPLISGCLAVSFLCSCPYPHLSLGVSKLYQYLSSPFSLSPLCWGSLSWTAWVKEETKLHLVNALMRPSLKGSSPDGNRLG